MVKFNVGNAADTQQESFKELLLVSVLIIFSRMFGLEPSVRRRIVANFDQNRGRSAVAAHATCTRFSDGTCSPYQMALKRLNDSYLWPLCRQRKLTVHFNTERNVHNTVEKSP